MQYIGPGGPESGTTDINQICWMYQFIWSEKVYLTPGRLGNNAYLTEHCSKWPVYPFSYQMYNKGNGLLPSSTEWKFIYLFFS